MAARIIPVKMAEKSNKDKIFGSENRGMGDVEPENPSVYSNDKVKDSNSAESIVKNGDSAVDFPETEVSNKEGEISKSGDRSTSAAESFQNLSTSSNGEKVKDSDSVENIMQHGNPIFEFVLTFMVLLSLPIKPIYDYVKASSPILQNSFQKVEKKATDALKFALNVGSAKWTALGNTIDAMKAKILGNVYPVLELLTLAEIRENPAPVLDYIDRIYLNIVPEIPNVPPVFNSRDESLSIKTRCFYMFLNLMQRLSMHLLRFVEHALSFLERRPTTKTGREN